MRLARAITASGLFIAIGGHSALACGSQVAATTICIEWAPITGDVVADRCTVARLTREALEAEFDPARVRTVADMPLPPRDVRNRMLADAQSATRGCP